jgi:hypothetical protein
MPTSAEKATAGTTTRKVKIDPMRVHKLPITQHNLRVILFNHCLTSVNWQTIVYIYQELDWVTTDQLLFETLRQEDPELGEYFHNTINLLEHYHGCLIVLLEYNGITAEPPQQPRTPPGTPGGDRPIHCHR